MFDIKVKKEQIEYARALVSQNNFGKRPQKDGIDSNGTQTQQLTGILGQTVFADKAQLSRPKVRKDGKWDGGFDYIICGKKVDIKTMHRTVRVRPEFTNNFVDSQLKYDCEYYIFASLLENKNKELETLTICGVSNKENLIKNARHYAAGTIRKMTNGVEFPLRFGMYELDMEFLHPVKDYNDIERYIMQDAIEKAIGGEIKLEKINKYEKAIKKEEEYKLKYPFIQNLVKIYREENEDVKTKTSEIIKKISEDKKMQEELKKILVGKIMNTDFNIAVG